MVVLTPHESSRLAKIVMRTGKLFLQSGGDVTSVSNTMKQICLTQPWARKPECIVAVFLLQSRAPHHHPDLRGDEIQQ